MTLLTYSGKYVLQSTGTVTTTSTTYGDDNVSQTFTLYGTKTVLVIYAANTAHGNTNSVEGLKNAISIDGVNHSEMCQSPYAANYSMKNTCVWVGSLDAGEHTIKGRLACNVASTTCNLTNRTLIIYILDGDEFDYIEDATAQPASSTTLADDTSATVTRTPSAACKALCFYGVTNVDAATERYAGKKIQLTIGGTARTNSLMGQSGYNGGNNADSVTTAFALSLASTSTTFQGQFAGNAAQTVTISKRFMCCLFFADDTILDVDYGSTDLNSITTVMADDTDISITRTHEGELLCLYAANKAVATSSAIYGTHYGIMLDAADVADSRSSPSYSTDAQGALVTYAASVDNSSHTIEGRFSTNTSTTAAHITSRQMIALWFPLKTPLTYKDKYIVQSGDTVTSAVNTFADDTPATKTFTLSASQTVLVFYNANSTYGNTNNVAGFKNAISVDSTDHAIMHATGYAANYPMRNACVWVGTLASGEHTIKGRFASNTNATNTSITNRTLMIYIFDGDDYRYIDNTTAQALAATETYTNDLSASISITPRANSKALILYGITNTPVTAEHYTGKKLCVAVNGTDYTDCEARQSSYGTGGESPDSVATAYALALTGNINYTFQGRIASVYTQETYVSRRFLAVLILDDTTLIDIDTSAVSENVASEYLVDDPDISTTRTTLGELIAFYAATKTSFTTSDIQGNRYGLMFDGHDVAHSRTSQAFSGSANSCLVGMGSTVFDQSHTIKGRFSGNEDNGAVYITNRCLTTIWLSRAVVSQDFAGSNDVELSKAFTVNSDVALAKAFSSFNDIIAQTLINKMFESTNDVSLSKAFSSSADLRLFKAFLSSEDLRLFKVFSSTGDERLNKPFASSGDLRLSLSKASSGDIGVSLPISSSNDILLWKSFVALNDIKLNKSFSAVSDVRLSKAFASANDLVALYTKLFASSTDIVLSKPFSSTSDLKLIKAFAVLNDIKVNKLFLSSNDITALYTVLFSSLSDIQLLKIFNATSDAKVIKTSVSLNDVILDKTFTSSSDTQVLKTFGSSDDIKLLKLFSSLSDVRVNKGFASSNDISALYTILFSNLSDIQLLKSFSVTSDIKVIKTSVSQNDVRLYKVFSAYSDIQALYTVLFASLNNIQVLKTFSSSVDIKLLKLFAGLSDIRTNKEFASSNDLNALYTVLFSNLSDIEVSKAFSSLSDTRLSKVFATFSDLKVTKAFSSSSDLIALYTVLFAGSNDIQLFKAFSASSDIGVIRAFQASSDVLCGKIFSSSSGLHLTKLSSASSDLRMSNVFSNSNEIFLNKSFLSSNEILGIIWTQFRSTNRIMQNTLFSSLSDIGVTNTFSGSNRIELFKEFASISDLNLDRIKSSRNDVELTKVTTSRNDIAVYRIYSSRNTVWYYSVKSSSNDITLLKNFVSSSDITLYKSIASTNDVFVTKHFSADSKVHVDHRVESSNNILLTKGFESMNDVLEFVRSIFASTNMILLAEVFESASDILLHKAFSSSNIIVRVIWDLNYPLTVVVSQDERTIVLTAISRKVYINNYINSAIVGATRKTVTIDQPDRSVSVTKW